MSLPVRGLRVRVPEHVAVRTFVEETVVLNLRTGQYHGLNRSGGRMMELLGELCNGGAVLDRLVGETGQPVSVLERDLAVFCEDLVARGLLELDDA